ncbi:ParA family protein [Rhodoblastus acidophilus]|uniref:ParA family protein n=1 Tax=Rhodoblastus acidophilus TaxID=1074 RepID=UPI0030B8B3DB
MRRVAFVTQKGGSGKCTLAACLAVAAREAGERVFLIDLDPLHSLSGWTRARGDGTTPSCSTNAPPRGGTPASRSAWRRCRRSACS